MPSKRFLFMDRVALLQCRPLMPHSVPIYKSAVRSGGRGVGKGCGKKGSGTQGKQHVILMLEAYVHARKFPK
jgi:hypothetical protein